ncbi:hypothetical protein Ccrd_019105 [Cynara cardunculus var. scolymus]|uniref:Uncharacterized protein n=1 Tax=Cynara cardunculus var. scolymus TaxID=59895 RepID=A0A103Y4X3_CYNCS|nr:hypothetical protein Ccrd_019105 [Cynara cardunculus var. scolymus]
MAGWSPTAVAGHGCYATGHSPSLSGKTQLAVSIWEDEHLRFRFLMLVYHISESMNLDQLLFSFNTNTNKPGFTSSSVV